MPIAKFVYNNVKNISISYILFKLNYGYYFWKLYKKDVDFCSKSKIADKLLVKLKKLVIVYWKNLHYSQKL